MRYALRPYEVPQFHQRADRRIHREKVAMDDRHDLAADMNLGAAAVIGTENMAYQFGREIRLNLPPRLDVHRFEIGLTETGFAVKVIEAGLLQAEGCKSLRERIK